MNKLKTPTLEELKKRLETEMQLASNLTSDFNNIWGGLMDTKDARLSRISELTEKCFNHCVGLEEAITNTLREILLYEYYDTKLRQKEVKP